MRIRSPRKKLFITVPFLLALFLLAAAPANRLRATGSNTPLFLPVVTYDSGGYTYNYVASIAVGDVNGDGKLDLVVGNECAVSHCGENGQYQEGSVGVLLGNGDGTFLAAKVYDSGGRHAEAVAIADVNGDGKPDIVVVNSDGKVGVLLGNGDGTFQSAVVYSSGGGAPTSVAVADVNSDGIPDLLVANLCGDANCDGTVGVLLGNGDGTFRAAVTYSSGGEYAQSVAVADVNHDGKPDLMIANFRRSFTSSDGVVGVLLGNGDGTFQPAEIYGSGEFYATSVAVADLNGDSNIDLVVSNQFGTVGVLLGNGDGTFQTAVVYGSGGILPKAVAVGDVNGDGRPDILATNQCVKNTDCDGAIGVLLGNGDGTFQAAVSYLSGGYDASGVAVGDVNGDGRPDLVVANSCTNKYKNNCGGTNEAAAVVGVLLNNTRFDTTPPVITLSATPKLLWPPNGKMVPVTISGTITDTGSGVNLTSAAYAVKDEYGDVQPKGAITLGPGGSYSFTVLLQASRLGTDLDGRRYTVIVQAKDNAGNRGSKTSAVTVPHDQGD